MSQLDMIHKLFGRPGQPKPSPLPRLAVEHDSVDKMLYDNYAEDSPRFKAMAIENAPRIAPDAPDPDPIDFTQATPDEIKAWQAEARAAKAKRDAATPYDAWSDLTRDVFDSYHHQSTPSVLAPDEVDPAVAAHAKIASKMMAEDAHAQARNITRGDSTTSAIATMGAVKALREHLENELVEQARQSEDFEEKRADAEAAMQSLDDLRAQAQQQHAQGGQVDPQLVQAIKGAVHDKRSKQAAAADAALASPVPFDKAAHEAVVAAAAAGAQAAKDAASIPGFGQGFGAGEPRYESPEQALSIADMWANNPTLRAVAELYGRFDQHFKYERAKRVVGGQDEIVDVVFGDDLNRVLVAELASLADDDYEDDFYSRYLSSEIRVFSTVGEEHAGRGPVVFVGDESSSMSGERNIWLKAIAMCLLNICRREKRDFAYVGFASGGQMYSIEFPAKKQLQANDIVEMASHFFAGGTTPVLGLAEATRVMTHAEFRKADIVMVTDGEAAFGPEDKRLRDLVVSRGVRIHGIGIGGSFGYLKALTEDVVHIHDFELEDPSAATAHLATHIT